MSAGLEPAPTPTPRPLSILLVEDSVDDALLLERYLRKNGFAPAIVRVETAEELSRALAGPVRPELVLADYNLPEFSGPAALQIVRATGLDIPFIMLSGIMTETTAVESMRAGAQDYVTKQNLARLVPAVERELREAADRTKKLAAEQALLASEDRFHRLVEAMPLGLLISDAAGKIVYANGAAETLFALTTGADVSIDELCPSLAELREDFTGKPFESTCLTTLGEKIEVLIGVALLNPDAAQAERQVAAFIADLTLQKKSEELLRRTEKLAVAGRLAASIAHEINNPLEAITNLLYLVGTTDLDPAAREYLVQAQAELDRVAKITVQTLRFHRRSTRATASDLQDLVDTALPLFEGRLRQMEAQVEKRFRSAPAVVAHDGEIRQVIANLVGNATDALGAGGRILLRVHAATDWRSGAKGVAVTVADTGSGISAEALPRIFEPFFSTKGNTGTGLGLWVSTEIVERHQGLMRVRSKLGAGTVFRLFLPLTSETLDVSALGL